MVLYICCLEINAFSEFVDHAHREMEVWLRIMVVDLCVCIMEHSRSQNPEIFPLGLGGGHGVAEGETLIELLTIYMHYSDHSNAGSQHFCPVKCVLSWGCYHFLPWVSC